MCGIAGLYRTHQSTDHRRENLKRLLAQVRHRGPDEMGYYFDDTVAIGTARLSIVDIETGQQPVGDADNRYWVVFNGEIYNYKELRDELRALGYSFSSKSDTEVLLNAWIAWGEQGLGRLNGAFAFCIYDRKDRTITLARDRFGKRPLFYIEAGDGIVFGSEIKCFLAYSPFKFEFDSQQLGAIFRTWVPLEDRAAFKHIKQVPAGAMLKVAAGSACRVDYAPLRLDRAALDISEQDASALLYETLSASVALRLRGDVTVAAYLSGGLDSAAVVHLMAERSSAAPRTYSVEFESSEFDESADQAELSNFLQTDHAALRVSDRDIAEAFPQALWHAEVPAFRSAFVPMYLLSAAVRRSGIKVVLTGEGADEAFLGYDIFKETDLRHTWKELNLESKRSKLARLYPYIPNFGAYDLTALTALFERFSLDSGSAFFSHEIRFHNSQLSGRLLEEATDPLQGLLALTSRNGASYSALSPVQKAQWLEYKTLLAGYLLSTQGDRMSLANSVENRCPFLDPDVVGLALATNLKFNDVFAEKHLLKRAFADRLPARVLKKPKQPYRAPDASAFLKASPDYLELINSESELKKVAVLNTKFCAAFVKKLLTTAADRVSQAENQAFMFLLSLPLLHRQFVEGRGLVLDDIDPLLTKTVDGRILQ